jgi:hypothetical protein
MKLRLFGIIAVIFLLSCFKSCKEVNYAIWGKKTEAVVTSIPRNTGKYGRKLNSFTVTYSAHVEDSEDGSFVGGYIVNEEGKEQFSVGDRIPIVYVKSNGMYYSRYAKESNVIYIVITLGFFVAFVVMGIQMWKQAGEDVAAAKRS